MAVYMAVESTAKFKIGILAQRDRSGVKCLLEERVCNSKPQYMRENFFLLFSSFFFVRKLGSLLSLSVIQSEEQGKYKQGPMIR